LEVGWKKAQLLQRFCSGRYRVTAGPILAAGESVRFNVESGARRIYDKEAAAALTQGLLGDVHSITYRAANGSAIRAFDGTVWNSMNWPQGFTSVEKVVSTAMHGLAKADRIPSCVDNR
jgi:hypothetical protein